MTETDDTPPTAPVHPEEGTRNVGRAGSGRAGWCSPWRRWVGAVRQWGE